MSKRILPVLAAALALAACGPKAPKGAGPADVAQAYGPLPADVPLYPGARITGVYGTESAPQVLAVSGDTTDRVAEFYGREMRKLGWKQDRSWYTRPDFLVFAKDRRTVSINVRNGAPAGAATMLSIDVRAEEG